MTNMKHKLSILVFSVLLLAMVSISAFAVVIDDPTDPNDIAAIEELPIKDDWQEVSSAHLKAMGDPNAPVAMTVYLDYACPYCTTLHTKVLKMVKDKYVDTGKVRMIIKNFPLDFHPHALDAAKGAECAARYGDFWDMHDTLYASQTSYTLDYNHIVVWGILNGQVDPTTMVNCMHAQGTLDAVKADRADGQQEGVTGTPTVFINGEKIVGAQPYAVYYNAIEAVLNPGSKYDLVVQDITVTPTDRHPGETGTAKIRVVNEGTLQSAPTYLDVFYNNQPRAHKGVPQLSPGGVYLFSVFIPFEEGQNTVKAVADATNAITESNEENNQRSYSFWVDDTTLLPDIAVSKIRLSPSNPAPGTQGSVQILFVNTGKAASGVFEADIFLDGELYERKTFSSLPSEGAQGVWHSIPVTFTKGYHAVRVVVDPNGHLTESNVINNHKYFTYTIQDEEKKPDFAARSLYTDTPYPKKGDLITLTYTFENRGNAAGQLWYTASLEPPQEPVGTTTMESESTPQKVLYLEPGESYSTKVQTRLQHTGKYVAKGIVDPDNKVDESNEHNNQISFTFYVGETPEPALPDVAVESIKVSPSDPQMGEVLRAAYLFANHGKEGVSFTYYTSFAGPNAHDEQAAQSSQMYLGPGETRTLVRHYEPQSSGYYYLRAGADSSNELVESNENNNNHMVKVYVRPASDTEVKAYLDQKFLLREGQSATVMDYKNLKITARNIVFQPPGDSGTLTGSGGVGGSATAHVTNDAAHTDEVVVIDKAIPANYVDIEVNNIPQSGKIMLHRDHLHCEDDSPVTTSPNGGLNQVFEVGEGTGYWNFKCKDRKQEQCYGDGSFDTYYKEWCEYPESTGSKQVRLQPGQTTSVNGVNLKLVTMTSSTATLLVTKKGVTAEVSTGIEPRTRAVSEGDKAYYTLIVKDGHSDRSYYTYHLADFGIPFANSLPGTISVRGGTTQRVSFWIDTSVSEPIPLLNKAETTNSGTTIELEDEATAEEYCLHNAETTEDYNECIQTVGVNIEDAVEHVEEGFQTYRFALRVSTSDARDVAYATLKIRQGPTPPEPIQELITLNLDKGWNLVSLGGNFLESFKDTSCEKRLISFVYLDNEQRYVSLTRAKDILGNDFDAYLSRHAFWVYAFESCRLKVAVDPHRVFEEFSLQEGWNTLPITDSMIGESLESMGHNCNIQKVYLWDAAQQAWNSVGEDAHIQQEQQHGGLIVKTGNYCQLGNTGVTVPPGFPAQ